MKEHLKSYVEFSKTPSVRGLRMLLEYFYALEIFEPIVKSNIRIISVFGSARSHPQSDEYVEAKKLGKLLYQSGYAVITGGSAGVMQGANEGVSDGIVAEMKKNKKLTTSQIMQSRAYNKKLRQCSVGLKISLPFEPQENPFVGVHATFHYFMIRKFFFGTLSSAFIACQGGWGTRDELFEMLTLVQTGKAPLMPIIYITHHPSHLLEDINYTIKKGYISEADRYLLDVVSNHEQAVKTISQFYRMVKKISYDKPNMIEITLSKSLSTRQKKAVKELVEKKYKNIFREMSLQAKKIKLKEFNDQSFGYLRKIVDAIGTS